MATCLTAEQYAEVVDAIMVARSGRFNALYSNLARIPRERWFASPSQPHNLNSTISQFRMPVGKAGLVPVTFSHAGRCLEHFVAAFQSHSVLVVFDPALPRIRQTRWYNLYQKALSNFVGRCSLNGKYRFVSAPGGPVQIDPESFTDPMCSFYSAASLRYLAIDLPLPTASRLRRAALVDAARRLRSLKLL